MKMFFTILLLASSGCMVRDDAPDPLVSCRDRCEANGSCDGNSECLIVRKHCRDACSAAVVR